MQDNNIAVRKVQGYTQDRSLTIVLPKRFALDIGIEKGDFMKVHLLNKQIIIEKAHIIHIGNELAELKNTNKSYHYITKNRELLERRVEMPQSSKSVTTKGDAS